MGALVANEKSPCAISGQNIGDLSGWVSGDVLFLRCGRQDEVS